MTYQVSSGTLNLCSINQSLASCCIVMSHVIDRQTDAADISKNSQHLMYSMQPKTGCYCCTVLFVLHEIHTYIGLLIFELGIVNW